MSAEMKDFFHAPTFSITYLLWDSESKKAAVIDCILDYDPISGRTSTKALDEVISSIEKHGLDLEWILETHPHADHMTGARTLQGRLGGKIAIGAAITKVQAHWRDVYGLGPDFPVRC